MSVPCAAVDVEDCVVAETRGEHLRCEKECAYADSNPYVLVEQRKALRAENARLRAALKRFDDALIPVDTGRIYGAAGEDVSSAVIEAIINGRKVVI